MKQLLQNLGTGEISLVESPAPARAPGFVLIANRCSLISSGTERSTVQAAQASLIGKARQRPDQVRKVLENVRREGLAATIGKVRTKLDEPKVLGYSSAGVVLESDQGGPPAGTRVACGGGGYACHAEIVVVPQHLVVPIPDDLDFSEAAFATVGAIALQGLRRAELELGERVLVVGLGLLGQLTWQLLRQAGCLPIGIDVSSDAVDRAKALGLSHAFRRGTDDIKRACDQLTGGHGVDAVLITAATKSTDPLELAGEVCRERGRVVLVGAVPIQIPREPYYMKELDFRISRSYGPGRYDPSYEEAGLDYPYGYVRFTEGRNMQAFVESMAHGVSVEPLISHRFEFDRAREAYDIVSGKNPEPHVGIILDYPHEASRGSNVRLRECATPTPGTIGIAFAGAGSFAQSYLLPHLQGRSGVELVGVATSRGYTAANVAKKFGFAEAHSDAKALINDDRVSAVFVATRHDLHAALVIEALRAGKHVFVEKPLALDTEELAGVLQAVQDTTSIMQVGFNRRFSPLVLALRKALDPAQAPTQITYRVNAGSLPVDHWLLDPKVGGGRIIGEGCHFVDLMLFLTGSEPVRVAASRLGNESEGATNMTIEFRDGSLGSLIYQANAPRAIPKERIEAFSGESGGIVHDFRSLEIFQAGKRRVIKARGQSKGYAEEIDAFLAAVACGKPAITTRSQALTTATTFAALRSISDRRFVPIELPHLQC